MIMNRSVGPSVVLLVVGDAVAGRRREWQWPQPDRLSEDYLKYYFTFFETEASLEISEDAAAIVVDDRLWREVRIAPILHHVLLVL